jgi:hypothetical protein
MYNKIKWAGIITATVIVVAACTPGTIPVMLTDVEGFELPMYAPDRGIPKWGDPTYRINHEGLSIKHSYRTSDDVIHIVLTGKISNGIPQGLLWNELTAGNYNIEDAKDFGITQTGMYEGQGDYRIGVVNAYGDSNLKKDDTTPTSTAKDVVALGSPDFSSEWVMAAPYSAVVISGLVDAGATGVTVTETNDSLNLFSINYRTDRRGIFSYNYDRNGILQYQYTYDHDPNLFRPKSGLPLHGRGGYGLLISKKANPQTAFFEIDYRDGKKRLIEVDYSEVTLREEIPPYNSITPPEVRFQNPTPTTAGGSGYELGTPEIRGVALAYFGDDDSGVPINLSDITVADLGAIPADPLYLRPFYVPANIDPSLASTYMIKEIYMTDAGGGSRWIGSEDLVLSWDDEVQAITLKFKEGGRPPSSQFIAIQAKLRFPFSYNGSDIDRLVCVVEVSSQ